MKSKVFKKMTSYALIGGMIFGMFGQSALAMSPDVQFVQEAGAEFTFGSQSSVLNPGTYVVPISLRNADHLDQKSIASDAFAAMAELTVNEDGSAVVKADMGAVNKGGLVDMARDIKVYQENNYTSEAKPVDVIDTVTNPEGVYRPDPEQDKIVPTQISFEIPDNSWDGVYVSLWVDLMNNAPDAWLQIDYANAKKPGSEEVLKGSAKVDQFGKYTIHTDVTVKDGVISNVAVTADDFISETHRPTNEMKIAQVTKALQNEWNGIAPTQDNAEQIYKKIMKPENPEEVLDAVSGASYSARAVRDAVMDACGLEYEDEVINVPESVEPGVYEVEVGYYSDIVWHSLVEDVKSTATLTVADDHSMTLDMELKSGTMKEPLYILGFNGVYPNNDRSQELTLEGTEVQMGLSSNDYKDQYFEKGTQVVNHVTFPLLGGMNKIYNTNCSLYVPAMNKLNGNLSGVDFVNGHFNADVFAKIYWDSMKAVEEKPVEPGESKYDDGQYDADVVFLHESKDKESMCNALFDQNAEVTVKDGQAEITVYAVNPVPAFPDGGADGTVKNVEMTIGDETYTAESDMETKAVRTFEISNPMFGMEAGSEHTTQKLTFTVPASVLTEMEKGVPAQAYVNVVMNKDTNFRIQLTNLVKVEEEKPEVPAIEDGSYAADVVFLHESKDKASICNALFDQNAEVTVKDGQAEITVYAVNPVPAFPDGGADGTVKNVEMTIGDETYTAESDMETKAVRTFEISNPMFGMEAGSEHTTQKLTFTVPASVLTEMEKGVPAQAYVNVVMNKDTNFRIQLTNLVKVEEQEPEVPTFADGKYTAAATMLHEAKDQPSMCDPMFAANADIEIKGSDATLKLFVANPVPAFPEQGTDGTVKNVVIDYNGQAYPVESQLNTGAKMTAKVTNSLFGLEAGKQYDAQVLTVTLPKEAIQEGALLKTDAYVNVVMMNDVVFRINLTDIKAAQEPEPTPADPVEEFVARLYTEILGREADEAGLNSWTEVLKAQKETGAKVAMGFVDSDEFKSKNMTDEEFVQIMYSTFLGRGADEGGLKAWVGELEAGMSRMFVFRGFVESDEFTKICDEYGIIRGNVELSAPMDQVVNQDTTKFVARCYNVFLGRKGDADGINAWVSQLASGKNNAKQAAYGFVMSAEFQGKNLSNEAYVSTMYIGLLNREADPAGLASWVKVLEEGGSREDIFNGFADSPEFRGLVKSYGLASDWK